jgi:hypothetical protein
MVSPLTATASAPGLSGSKVMIFPLRRTRVAETDGLSEHRERAKGRMQVIQIMKKIPVSIFPSIIIQLPIAFVLISLTFSNLLMYIAGGKIPGVKFPHDIAIITDMDAS